MALYERGYIMDVVTLQSIPFNYYEPPSLDGGNAEWVQTPIRMRSEPHHTWVNTSAQAWPITGKIVASMEQGDNRTGVNVKDDVAFLKSFEYPDYVNQDGLVIPPHRARVWLKGALDGIGIISGVGLGFQDITDQFDNQLVVDVTFTFTVVNKIPLSYEQVRNKLI